MSVLHALGLPLRRAVALCFFSIAAIPAGTREIAPVTPSQGTAQVDAEAQSLPDSISIILFSLVLLGGATFVRRQRANSRTTSGSRDYGTALRQPEPMVAFAQKELS